MVYIYFFYLYRAFLSAILETVQTYKLKGKSLASHLDGELRNRLELSQLSSVIISKGLTMTEPSIHSERKCTDWTKTTVCELYL